MISVETEPVNVFRENESRHHEMLCKELLVDAPGEEFVEVNS